MTEEIPASGYELHVISTENHDWTENAIASYALAIETLREGHSKRGFQVKALRNGFIRSPRSEPLLSCV